MRPPDFTYTRFTSTDSSQCVHGLLYLPFGGSPMTCYKCFYRMKLHQKRMWWCYCSFDLILFQPASNVQGLYSGTVPEEMLVELTRACPSCSIISDYSPPGPSSWRRWFVSIRLKKTSHFTLRGSESAELAGEAGGGRREVQPWGKK